MLERKTREAELLTARLVEESERRAAEANKLKDELLRARAAEKQAKEKLLDFLSRSTSYTTSVPPSPISVSAFVYLQKSLKLMSKSCGGFCFSGSNH